MSESQSRKSSTTELTRSKGIEMAGHIMGAVAHIVDDQPSEVVIEAMAVAMMATLTTAGITNADAKLILRRYADRIAALAAALSKAEQIGEMSEAEWARHLRRVGTQGNQPRPV